MLLYNHCHPQRGGLTVPRQADQEMRRIDMTHTLTIVTIETTYVGGTFYVSPNGVTVMYDMTVTVEYRIFICEAIPASRMSALRSGAAQLLHGLATI